MFKVNNKNTRVNDVLLVFLLLTLNIFHMFFLRFYGGLKQVSVSCVNSDNYLKPLYLHIYNLMHI